jgi:hypothetical protein
MATQIEVPTVNTPHTEAAQALVETLRAMRQAIPNLVIPTTRNAGQRLSRAASVPPQFVELTAVAVKNSQALVRGGGADPTQIRDLMSYAEAYSPFADELEAFAHFVRHSVNAAKNKAGFDALTTYSLARRLAKRPETADLAPHVEDMRRALGIVRKSAKPAVAKVVPVVTPVVEPPKPA